MKKKGFTLIELLTVIVVLAIIALIAVPIVLNIIERARKNAAIASARSYIKATETYVISSELDKTKLQLEKSNKYNVKQETQINGKNYLKINDLVELRGTKPTGNDDYVILNEKYRVTEALLTINGYEILIKNDEVITVIKGKKVDVDSISLNKTKETMEKGSSFVLETIFNPNNASDQRVKYVSSDKDIVTVNDEGVVTANNVGNAKIIVTSVDNTSKKAECDITVVINATGLKIEPPESEILVGETVTLVGTIEPSNSTTSSLMWTTSDINIASVDENGIVTGISKGETIITATTINGIESTSKITVKEILPESIILDNTSTSIEIGKTLQLNATITPNNATNKAISWMSSDETIAKVDDNGLVTGLKEGTVKITATTSNGLTAEVNITIYVPKTLSSVVSVGDYVAYDAGTWSETKERPTSTNYLSYGGYTAGQNKANSVGWCYTEYRSVNLRGWRVFSISGETVTIIHAGEPECYYHRQDGSGSITSLNNRAVSEYLNSTYASSAHMMNSGEAYGITGSYDSTYNNLRWTNDEYWVATCNGSYLSYVDYLGKSGSTTVNRTMGVRPIVVLKSGIKTAGMGKDVLGQNAWTLVAP